MPFRLQDVKYLFIRTTKNGLIQALIMHWINYLLNGKGLDISFVLIRYGTTEPIVAKTPSQEKEASDSHYFDVNISDVMEGTKNINFNIQGDNSKKTMS